MIACIPITWHFPMADKTPEPEEDAVSRAARRWAERRDQHRANAAAARDAQVDQEPSGQDAHIRKFALGLLVVTLLAAAGWFLLVQMRCSQRYSNVSGFLFNECR